MAILENLDLLISESRSRWSAKSPRTLEMEDAFNDTPEGSDLKSIGVSIAERTLEVLILQRSGPMAGVEIFKNSEGKFCYEYTSTKEGVERYALHKFDTPQECLRSLLLRIVRNNIPGAIIPKKDIPKLNFDELIPIGSNLSMKEILERAKEVIGGFELSDPDPEEVVELPIIENLEDMGMVGGKPSPTSPKRKIIEKVDIIAPKYKFYSRAALRAGEIYGDLISEITGVNKSYLGGLLFGRNTKRGATEIWRVNNSNRLPLNSINFRTGDNSVKCNIQDPEIFGSVFLAIFKRTFKRAKGKYPDEFLLTPTFMVMSRESNKVSLIEELNLRLSDYFTEAAEDLDPTVFVDPGQENTQIGTNAKAILIKYLMKNGSNQLRQAITSNPRLDDLLDLATKQLDINDLSRKLIDVSRALRFV
jgi:hypothetical protein